jgi:sugar lactone lactonase YvrE
MAELVWDARNIVGESLVWDAARGTLVWVDIVGRRIFRLAPGKAEPESWDAPEIVTSIGLARDGSAVVGLRKRVVRFDFAGNFTTIAEVEPDVPGNRLNEGVVAPDGSFWVGTMQNNIAPDGAPLSMDASTGRLWRVTAGGEVTPLCEDRFGITNTLAWPGDGTVLTADTLANTIYSYDLAPDGSLGARRAHFEGFERGVPDGSCLDAEAHLWNCRVVGGACLARIAPDGALDRVEELPCAWPTSCAFGGPGLATLYVTSARFTMSEAHLAAHPHEGGLFALQPGVAGTPPNLFG